MINKFKGKRIGCSILFFSLFFIFFIGVVSSLEIGTTSGSGVKIFKVPPSTTSNGTSSGNFSGVHNDLTGIQGGQATEYYHLTNADYTNRIFLFNQSALTYNFNQSNLVYNFNQSALTFNFNQSALTYNFNQSNLLYNFNQSNLNNVYALTTNQWLFNQSALTYNFNQSNLVYNFNQSNFVWQSTYNVTYAQWSFNQSNLVYNFNQSNLNNVYALTTNQWLFNQSNLLYNFNQSNLVYNFNQSNLDLVYSKKASKWDSNATAFWNSTVLQVGIGTETPKSALTIYDATNSKEGQRIRIGQSLGFDYTIGRDTGTGFLTFNGSQIDYVGYDFINASGTNIMTINGQKSTVGIGTASSTYKLEVSGVTYLGHFVGTVNPAIQLEDASVQLKMQTLGSYGTVGTQTNHPIHIISNNVRRISVLGTGEVGIGTVIPDTKLNVNGSSNITDVLNVDNYYSITGVAGTNFTGIPAGGVTITGGIITSASASSERYKKEIENYTTNFTKIFDLQLKSWEYTEDAIKEGKGINNKTQIGYVAEDVNAIGLTNSVFYNAQGQIDNYNPFHVTYYLLEIVKAQDKQIQTLQIENNLIKEELCLKDNSYSWCK